MTLHQYLDTLKNKTVAVVGIGVSNTPLAAAAAAEESASPPAINAAATPWAPWRRSWKRPAAACSWGRTTYRA